MQQVVALSVRTGICSAKSVNWKRLESVVSTASRSFQVPCIQSILRKLGAAQKQNIHRSALQPNAMNDYESTSYENSNLNPYDYESTASRDGKGCRNWAIGCSVVALLALTMIGIGGFVFVSNAKPFAAKQVVNGIKGILKETDLSAEQKEQIVTRVEVLGEDFVAGDITMDELVEIASEIAESRKVHAGAAEFIINKTVEDKLELTPEDQANVKRLVQRLARGIVEEKLGEEDFEPLMEVVCEKQGENHYEIRDDLSQEQIQQFLAELETLVDTAEIPDEPYEVDIANEIDRIIDEVRSDE